MTLYEAKCICSMGYSKGCRLHDELSKAAHGYATSYVSTVNDILNENLEGHHIEMFEIAYKNGYEAKSKDHDLEVKKLKLENEMLKENLENWVEIAYRDDEKSQEKLKEIADEITTAISKLGKG